MLLYISHTPSLPGPHKWSLLQQVIDYPKGLQCYRLFAMFLLQGKVRSSIRSDVIMTSLLYYNVGVSSTCTVLPLSYFTSNHHDKDMGQVSHNIVCVAVIISHVFFYEQFTHTD